MSVLLIDQLKKRRIGKNGSDSEYKLLRFKKKKATRINKVKYKGKIPRIPKNNIIWCVIIKKWPTT
jgi:hypothetical protein